MQNSDLESGSRLAPLMPKVERQRLHDTVVDHTRRFIVEGVLEPGKKLN